MSFISLFVVKRQREDAHLLEVAIVTEEATAIANDIVVRGDEEELELGQFVFWMLVGILSLARISSNVSSKICEAQVLKVVLIVGAEDGTLED